ncbi:hypothetical protein KIN20_019837 [Parelaphostrongylus tenuis]|uniref:Tyrosine-protein phosphatase domain-containing protein n=1 Tax=Parelaphostrongylus tenuis TaxID=148309 RepID=A0AAD5N964_PARTN|nr:hypothetical protein KIN20_019837 [Parelaphostrongylus tenuis]
MIWQQKCKSIIMLCNATECGKPRCEQYRPLTAESPMDINISDIRRHASFLAHFQHTTVRDRNAE